MSASRVGSVVSSSSTGSRYSKRYRTKSKQSSIDEALFGNTKSFAKDAPPQVKEKKARPAPKPKREMVEVITKDLIRKFRVPSDDPSGLTVVLQRTKFAQLMKASSHKTRLELRQENELAQKEKIAAAEDSQRRKDEMKEAESRRRTNTKLNDLEQEAKDKANVLLTRANRLRLEQEDEIKGLNELILNAKCHAIRDAQVLEKQAVKDEAEEEEMRLDTMMEIDRVNAIKATEEIGRMRKKQRYLGAQQLLKQIERNAQEKVIVSEQKEQETKLVLKKLEEMHVEDVHELKQKKIKQKILRAEIEKIKEEDQRAREFSIKQEKLNDFKVLQYMKLKAEREAEVEAENLRIRKEKEYETARMRNLQEKANDLQAEKDALRAKRNQEQAERDWRKKEGELLRKKRENDAMMMKARTEQIESKEHFMSVQAQRERSEFERILRDQKRQIASDQDRDEALLMARLRNSDLIRKQIRDKEQEKLDERKTHFEEGVRMEEEARLRRVRLNEVKTKKLVELREAGIPMKYCSEIERKVNKPRLMC